MAHRSSQSDTRCVSLRINPSTNNQHQSCGPLSQTAVEEYDDVSLLGANELNRVLLQKQEHRRLRFLI